MKRRTTLKHCVKSQDPAYVRTPLLTQIEPLTDHNTVNVFTKLTIAANKYPPPPKKPRNTLHVSVWQSAKHCVYEN